MWCKYCHDFLFLPDDKNITEGGMFIERLSEEITMFEIVHAIYPNGMYPIESMANFVHKLWEFNPI